MTPRRGLRAHFALSRRELAVPDAGSESRWRCHVLGRRRSAGGTDLMLITAREMAHVPGCGVKRIPFASFSSEVAVSTLLIEEQTFPSPVPVSRREKRIVRTSQNTGCELQVFGKRRAKRPDRRRAAFEQRSASRGTVISREVRAIMALARRSGFTDRMQIAVDRQRASPPKGTAGSRPAGHAACQQVAGPVLKDDSVPLPRRGFKS
jgi:hypothetical protein